MEEQLIRTAHQLINNAKAVSDSHPEEAKKLFLAASQKYIEASKVTKVHQKAYVNQAQRLYLEAKRVEAVKTNVDEKGGQSLSDSIRMKKPELRFSDVAGLEDVKEDIRMKIIEPFKNPDIYEFYGKKAGGGILMYGPPGCGKSMIAEATAGEADATFFNVRASDLKSKYVGETERNIAKLFDEARKHQPSIIFFDEFESLGANRSHADPHSKSAVSELLSQMNGVGTKDNKILLIAATNVPWEIDVALRREGRFGQTVFVSPPDTYARYSLMDLKMKKRPLADDVKLMDIALQTKGFSGADLVALVEKATDIPLKEFMHTKNKRPIKQLDLEEALVNSKPSIDEWFKEAKIHLKRTKNEEHFPEVFSFDTSDPKLDSLLDKAVA